MITDNLKEAKRLEQLETVAKVTAAMKTIEAEVGRDGYYAQNGGQITLKELSRRAGIGQSTLKNIGHKEFLRIANAWKARMRATVAILLVGPVSPRNSVKNSVDQIGAFQQLNAFKILYDEMSAKVARLEAENAQLRKILTKLSPNYVI